jgi:hypothetical protein
MNDQLQVATSEAITKATSGIDASVNFLSSEIPEVIHQLLMWKMIEASFVSVVCIIIFISLVKYTRKNSGEKTKVDTNGKTVNCCSMTHDENHDVAPWICLTMTFIPLIFIITFFIFCDSFLDVVQIWIAPKIYLIEYAASLVKN